MSGDTIPSMVIDETGLVEQLTLLANDDPRWEESVRRDPALDAASIKLGEAVAKLAGSEDVEVMTYSVGIRLKRAPTVSPEMREKLDARYAAMQTPEQQAAVESLFTGPVTRSQPTDTELWCPDCDRIEPNPDCPTCWPELD